MNLFARIEINQLFQMFRDRLNLAKGRVCSKIKCEQNPYSKQRLIGQGTFGKVYQVLDRSTKQVLALKEVVQDPKYKNRQLSMISVLSHPNLIEMKDYFFTLKGQDCILYIVMELMDSNLQNMIQKQRPKKAPIDPALRKIYAFQILKGLYYLRLNHLCHRDLKPANILIDIKDHKLKICDFGSAKIIKTSENNVCYICSRYYRAPELLLNCTTYGSQIDMWSAGCIFLELLTLQPVFPGDSSLEQLIEIIKLLGAPTQQNMASYSSISPAITFPGIKPAKWSVVFKRYKPMPIELDFITSILTYDRQKRLTPFQALKHPYFHDIQDLPQSKVVPELFNFQTLNKKSNSQQIIQLQKLYPINFSKEWAHANQPDSQEQPSHDYN